MLQQARRVMGEAGVALSATWNETLPLWLYHRDNGAGYECTHYCAPSAPQVYSVKGNGIVRVCE